MKGIEDIRRRACEIEARVHAGSLATFDEDGKPAWVQGREAITLMRQLLIVARDTGSDELALADVPEDLRHKVSLWSKVQLIDDSGELSRIVKKQCQEIVER